MRYDLTAIIRTQVDRVSRRGKRIGEDEADPGWDDVILTNDSTSGERLTTEGTGCGGRKNS